MIRRVVYVLIAVQIFFGCDGIHKSVKFKLLDSHETGITFSNTLFEDDSINGINFEYIYNGSGVAVGDLNNDGLEDIFFAGNMVTSELYLNQGGLDFMNVTEESGVTTSKWCTGVSIIDVNTDGLKDIYICVAGLDHAPGARDNILFINQGIDENGIPNFMDLSEDMGVNDAGYSTMGVFFDFDKDHDLDLFILTNAMDGSMRSSIRDILKDGTGESTDRLYRNNGNEEFENISIEAGIVNEGYGLGVGITDINQDGWLDIYCANDFISNDLLYINNQDGTFSEQSAKYFNHFTHNGMGMDMADINNDALIDVMVLDMLPEDNTRQKLMIASNMKSFNKSVAAGYHPQFLRNTLQLNRGKFPDGRLRFSEVAFLAGIYQTDWSWAPLMIDLDNNGWKDLLITNGFRKDVTNLDYIEEVMKISRFGTKEANELLNKQAMERLEDVKLQNYIFKNTGSLEMTEVAEDWGLSELTFTNGTAYADFDNDGDLDLVFNNLDQEATFYENNFIDQRESRPDHHYLQLRFDASVLEVDKIGLNAWVYQGQQNQYIIYSPFRGYKSTVGEVLHFGLGQQMEVDSLIVQWPDGQVNNYYNLHGDTILYLSKHEGKSFVKNLMAGRGPTKFQNLTNSLGLGIEHIDSASEDMNITHTLLHSLSNYGPSLSVGDINGDGLDDLFMSGDQMQSGQILVQLENGKFDFRKFPMDSNYHDMGSLLFDADNDGDFDLYVVSGGYHLEKDSDWYQDRLYLNNGWGSFERTVEALPTIGASGSCVVAADYDQDGDIDLFVGGRTSGRSYPKIPQSYLLENNEGTFEDKSNLLGSKVGKLGMVTSALWSDINQDNLVDLIIVGEWMKVTVLVNDGAAFSDQSASFGVDNLSGWWNSINGADLDNDGDTDYILGNYGLNSFYKASDNHPLEMYSSDLDKNGSLDPIITHYNGEEKFVVNSFTIVKKQVPGIVSRFKTYTDFGQATFENSFTPEEVESALHFECKTMETIILENVEGKSLKLHHLPIEVQFSPVFGTSTSDINQDGLDDIILVGNSMHEETTFGNYDASLGDILVNRGNFQWDYFEPTASGFIAEGDKKALVKFVNANNEFSFLISENGRALQAYKINDELALTTFALEKDDWYLTYNLQGQKIKKEMFYGQGFLSSSTRRIAIPAAVDTIEIVKFNGEARQLKIDQKSIAKDFSE